ncbi:MAG: glycosyltransferase family 2 protein [Hyphomicrobiaceae bacterium]
MRNGHRVGAIIPAFDEEDAIGHVLGDIPAWVDVVVVADNASRDKTAKIAKAAGVIVSHEPQTGYGATCLAGLAALPGVDIVVFLDGDYSDYPEDMAQLVDPITAASHDFVLASRAMGEPEVGALTPQQIFGNWLATRLIYLIWGARFTDLGPFRAISKSALDKLKMSDRTYGWTVEMQIKAIEHNLRFKEVPARYRMRIGHSKVSGTVKGTVLAGYKILSLIAKHSGRRLVEKFNAGRGGGPDRRA